MKPPWPPAHTENNLDQVDGLDFIHTKKSNKGNKEMEDVFSID